MNEIQKKLYEINHPTNHSNARVLIYKIGNGGCGVGCEIHKIAPALSMCYHTNRALIIYGDWQFSTGKNCTDRTYTQWFESVSNCEIKKFRNADEWNGKNDSKQVLEIRPDKSYSQLAKRYVVPNEYRERGNIWWLGQLVYYIMRPNDLALKLIQETKAKLNIKYPFMGVSVRHSSRWWGRSRKNISLNEHEKRMRSMGIGNKEVFISTEDQDVIDETEKYRDYNWKYTDNPRTNVNHFVGLRKKGNMDGWEEGKIAMVNLFIMRECNRLVCTFRSNWGRLVYEHMVALNDKYLPAVSVEKMNCNKQFGLGFEKDYDKYFVG